MLTVLWSNHGVEQKLIEHLDGEVIAEHSTPDHVETLVEAGEWGTGWIREMAVQAGTPVFGAFPAQDGWFAHDEGGGVLITDGGIHWESLEEQPSVLEQAG